MDINEFSIACKLINLKLRSFDIPKQLPGPLLVSLKQHQLLQQQQQQLPAARSPLAANNYAAMPPAAVHNTTSPPKVPPMVPPMTKPLPPLVQPMMMQPQQHPHQPPAVPPMTQPAAATIQPLIPGMGAMMQQQQHQLLQSPPDSNMSLLLGNVAAPHPAAHVSALPAPPTPPSGTPSRSASINGGLAAEARSPPHPPQPLLAAAEPEWAVRPQSKLKYTQLFNTTDRTRCGFLTGAQARHLMVQSKLPQAQLAQIWAMSDMDLDGRLGCEEFVLAMYLCECAAQGEKIPDKLPPELVPPMFRKRVGSMASLSGGIAAAAAAGSRHDSVVSATGGIGGIVGAGSRHGSVSSQGGALAAAATAAGGASMVDGAMDAMAGLHNQSE